MRTRTRGDSTANEHLPLSWNDGEAEVSTRPEDIPLDERLLNSQDTQISSEEPQPAMTANPEQEPPQQEVSALTASEPEATEEQQPLTQPALPGMEDLAPEQTDDSSQGEDTGDETVQHQSRRSVVELPKLPEHFSESLKKYMEKASVSAKDLEQKLPLPSVYLSDLINGNFQNIKNQSLTHLKMNLKKILAQLGVSDLEAEAMENCLEQEYRSIYPEVIVPQDSQDAIPDPSEELHPRGNKVKFAKIFILAVLLMLVLVILGTKVLPLISKPESSIGEYQIDLAPLVTPEKPAVLPIPIP